MFIKLPETEDKVCTIINAREIICFNENSIAFKNGLKLGSCDKWFKEIENFLKTIPIDY